MTKFVLVLVMCSLEANTCMEPYKYPLSFKDGYDCMVFGYKESLSKIEEIGREDINEHQIYIKFGCTPENTI